MKHLIGVFFFLILTSGVFITPFIEHPLPKNTTLEFVSSNSIWADSIIQTLSLDEKIGQLLMVAAYSNKDKNHTKQIDNLITNYHIGGLIFMQGGPVRQAQLYNRYQKLATIPLLVSIDGEWGLAMRLDSTIKYPWQMTLGAIQDNDLIYNMGVDIAEQCKRLGIQVNFAPVVDVNVNPKNPIINARSFGENKQNVAQKGIAYMKGMQSLNVLANAKHFPGHGDTDKDSHKALPIINHTKERLDSIELYPFKELINNGLTSMMVAHLFVPAYDTTKNTATTLSKNVVTYLLKDSLKFEGLIFTDALNMKGVSSFNKPGYVDVKALLAGNDVLLFSENVPTAVAEIKKAVENGEISEEEITARCLKILKAKAWAGLNKSKQVKTTNLYRDLNQKKYELLNKKLFEKALTVLKNDSSILPLQHLETLKIASLSIGNEGENFFQKTLDLYTDVTHFSTNDLSSENTIELLNQLKEFNTILVSIHKSDVNPWKRYSIDAATKNIIAQLNKTNHVILTVFANPYSLMNFDAAEKSQGLIMAYQNNKYTQEAAAQLIFGAIGANGKLPVSISKKLPEGTGISFKPNGRLQYREAEEAGIQERDLYKIDSIALFGIREKAYPGCQVFVAKDGKVIYNKSFGYHTYDSTIQVTNNSIYDIASVTKIVSPLLSVMQLQDKALFSLDKNLGDYLHELIPDTSPYFNLNLREILAHQSGLQAWVPFYIKTMRKGVLDPVIYHKDSSTYYPFRVANNIYINKEYPDIIFQRILRGPIKAKEYKYSDLGYYFLMKIAETQSGKPLNEYVENVYAQLGMNNAGYLPRNRFSLDRIPPTENDTVFRKQLIHGDVHDPGSAMMGGVGGHAGIFTNANDLGKIMQMYLNKGTYGGEQYIKDTTLNEFTKCQFCEENGNRRAAGFDKPIMTGGGPTCNCVSYLSFGHSGFTGTLVWADPVENVVYVFLSNRVHPHTENNKLLKLNIRTNIQQVIYDAINKQKQLVD
ncbi:MAG: serine hydrolase [Vicingaceae bacterium]|nr:serine hydrolase [Vicingaceae bacterium]